MTPDSEPMPTLDDCAMQPTAKHLLIAAVVGYFWAGIAPDAILPVGLLVLWAMLGNMTHAITFAGRVRFGWKALAVGVLASAVGYSAKAGVFLFAADGAMQVIVRIH